MKNLVPYLIIGLALLIAYYIGIYVGAKATKERSIILSNGQVFKGVVLDKEEK